MNDVQVALYARVSSEKQAEAKTIASQLAELEARIRADGIAWANVLSFVDEGYSGATLASVMDNHAAGRRYGSRSSEGFLGWWQ